MDIEEAFAAFSESDGELATARNDCPLCGEELLAIGGMVRCVRCGMMLCESCDGAARS